MEILNVKNLSFTYPNSNGKCLSDISFTVNSGDLVVMSGISGCGKTTLLRLLKPQLAPFGERCGSVSYKNKDLYKCDEELTAFEIGFLMQTPDFQIVSDKVFSELSFGLQNMGLSQSEIKRKICEVSDFLGISDLFYRDISTLSGGQKQLVSLASVIAMNPKLLLLDEPTSQLDPISSARFFNALTKLNRELGITIIIAEHRLNELWSIADKILFLDDGKKLIFDTPGNTVSIIKEKFNENPISQALPCCAKIYNEFNIDFECPLSIRDSIRFIEDNFKSDIKSLEHSEYTHNKDIVLELKNVFARYEKDSCDVLKDTNLTLYKNECLCVLGSNGAGKSTMLKACAGLLKAHSGKIKVFDKKISDYKHNTLYDYVALLPQDPKEILICQTVLDDLLQVKNKLNIDDDEFELQKNKWCEVLGIKPLLSMHPYDLSGGQLQKVALAKLLLLNPKILLLDEPVKGLDACAKDELSNIFKDLTKSGISILIVTHDIEFSAICADRCALFWGGQVVCDDVPRKFFSDNKFYSTAANRISRNIYDNAITSDDVIKLCKINGVV